MKRKAIISLILILSIILSVSACEKKQKKIVLTSDVKQEATMQENEIKKFIADGTDFLNNGKYDDAKSTFEKAISMDKANKGAYIEIKNKYMEKQRIDDAYYIIKLAISNNVDTENMKVLLNDMKTKFEVAKLDVDVYQNNAYNLPTKIKVKINNKNEDVDVVWNNTSVDTSKLESIKYEGKIVQYDRSAELNLNVIKVEKIKKVGWISELYEENGKKHLKFDDVEFFLNKDSNDETADIEARKDDADSLLPEGSVTDDYYIRNKDDSLVTYNIAPNVEISVCGWTINLDTIDKQKISYDKFKALDKGYGPIYKKLLCYIYLENNEVVKIEEQFRP